MNIGCSLDGGQWTPDSRKEYNLRDAVSRSTIQVITSSSSSSSLCLIYIIDRILMDWIGLDG